MRLYTFYILLLTFIFSSCETEKPVTSLKLMTYNIRLDTASDGENAWGNRKDFLTSQVLFLQPDIMGVQEAKPNQIEDLNSSLVDYDYIGNGRDREKKGEHSAIYYSTKNLKVEQAHTFWLSPTPEEFSQGWDAAHPRICTFGLFTKLDSDEKFWVFNTHLDHVGAESQKKGIQLILKKMKVVNAKNYPIVLMGDLNVEPTSEVILTTQSEFSDAKDLAKIKFGPDGTFNGFKYAKPVTRRIDYILLSKSSKLEVEKYAVFSSAVDFKFPSDHFPVFVEIEL